MNSKIAIAATWAFWAASVLLGVIVFWLNYYFDSSPDPASNTPEWLRVVVILAFSLVESVLYVGIPVGCFALAASFFLMFYSSRRIASP